MPEPLRVAVPLCQSQGPEGWFCTLPAGHDGDHVATVGPALIGAVVELDRWPLSASSKACPYCDRMMSARESARGACDDCAPHETTP